MYNLVAEKTQIVDAEITATGFNTTCKFENIPNMATNNIIVYGIQVFTATQQSISPNSGKTVLPASALPSLTLTLVDEFGGFPIQDVPTYDLVASLNGGFKTPIKDFKMNLTACYLKTVNTTGLTVGQVLLIQLFYRDKK